MRTTRQWNEASRQKLSASTKGKPKSERTKERIRQSMIRYWQTIPSESIPDKASADTKIGRLGKAIEGTPNNSLIKGHINLPQETPQEVPEEPIIKNDVGIWEEITRDLITYQGKGSAKNGNNNERE